MPRKKVAAPPKAEGDAILGILDRAEHNTAAEPPRITCAADLIPFCKVPSPSGRGLIQMESWPFIVKLLEWWEGNDRTACKKARQLGATYAYALRALYLCGWRPFQSICSLNYTKEQGCEVIDRMRILWESLPKAWRPAAKFTADYAFFPKTGSKVFPVATTDAAGAGNTVTELFIDEAGLIKNLNEIWASVTQTAQGGKVHVVSTPREATQYFSAICKEAQAGSNGFVYQFIPYSAHPDRDPNTERGRLWKEQRMKELGPQKFAREYEGVFTVPGNSYFTAELILKLEAYAKDKPFKLAVRDRLRIYEPFNRALQYVGGADVAEGLADGDYSAAHIVTRCGRVVAAYHAHVGPRDYAEDLRTVALMYGSPWLAIEANNHGHAVTQWLYYKLRYLKILRDDQRMAGKIVGGQAPRLGILTTGASKPSMLTNLEDDLRNGRLICPDIATVAELQTFVDLGGGTYGASPGTHDDRVMSLALAQCARLRRIPRMI